MKQKRDTSTRLCAEFDSETADYRREAVCRKGCAFCCTAAGRIDATTLEGLVIRERLAAMPRIRQTGLKKAIGHDVKRRRAGGFTPCPFLMKTGPA